MIQLKERVRLLQKSEFFSPLDPKILLTVAQYSREETCPEGEYIFKAGDPGNCLFILDTGIVSILLQKESGEEEEIARYVEGDSFGELDLITHSHRNAHAKTQTQVTLLRFPRRGVEFSDLLFQHPKAGAQLMWAFLVATAGRIRKSNNLLKENSPWIQELRRQVYRDKLTGLYNRTFLEERLPDYLKDSKRSVSILMVKPDNFKQINDTYGHEAGDRVLVRIASCLNSLADQRWIAVRYMGNELGYILPDTSSQQAREIAHRVQENLSALDISDLTGGASFSLSVSIGIATFPDHSSDPLELISLAHQLPLIGRTRGGNMILFPDEKGDG
ncbi:MAG TPA: GGDEF domain-containing protein [Spirochaetales bacterium]|nr:GGDEF domain-containing protein [Spirochaetales bacterium]